MDQLVFKLEVLTWFYQPQELEFSSIPSHSHGFITFLASGRALVVECHNVLGIRDKAFLVRPYLGVSKYN